jgi:hypothetical protein
MTNVEKLTQLGIIGDVRQRYGAEQAADESKDKFINQEDHDSLIYAWAGWHLGDGSWWTTMKAYYDGLERLSK